MAFTVHKEITMGKLKTLIFLPMYETIFFIAIKFKSCQNSQDKDGLSLSRHNPVTLKLYINPHQGVSGLYGHCIVLAFKHGNINTNETCSRLENVLYALPT